MPKHHARKIETLCSNIMLKYRCYAHPDLSWDLGCSWMGVHRHSREHMPLWSELPIGGMVSQLSTSSGDVDSIRLMVVADEIVTRIWPVGMRVRAC